MEYVTSITSNKIKLGYTFIISILIIYVLLILLSSYFGFLALFIFLPFLRHLLLDTVHNISLTRNRRNVYFNINLDYLLISRVLCRWFRARRKNTEIPSLLRQKLLRERLVDEIVGEESFMPTENIGIPIIVR